MVGVMGHSVGWLMTATSLPATEMVYGGVWGWQCEGGSGNGAVGSRTVGNDNKNSDRGKEKKIMVYHMCLITHIHL